MESNPHLKYALEFVGKDPLATFLGIKVEHVGENSATISLDPQPHHLNNMKRVHGSTLYALADQAAAVASNSSGKKTVLVEGRINFLAAAPPDRKLTARAEPVSPGQRITLWDIKITSGEDLLVATAQAVSYNVGYLEA